MSDDDDRGKNRTDTPVIRLPEADQEEDAMDSDFAAEGSGRIESHRTGRKKRLILLLVLTLCTAAVCALLYYLFRPVAYSSYSVIGSTDRTDSNTVKYASYQNGMIKYSRDGAAALSSDGSTIWNGSYNMQNPALDICGQYAVAADIGGTDLYVFNGSDSGTQIETIKPILMARVAAQGVTAVLTEDSTADTITLYNPYDSGTSVIGEIPINIVSDGIPVNFAISPDGTKIALNVILSSGGTITDNLTFYSFDEIGETYNNHIVSTKSYGETLIGKIQFISDDISCIFTSDGFSVFRGSEIPELKYEVKLDQEIRSIFQTDSCIGVVTENTAAAGNTTSDNTAVQTTEEGTEEYRIRIYDFSHEKPRHNFTTDFLYEKIQAQGKELYLYSGSECRILTFTGRLKADLDAGSELTLFGALQKKNTYFFVNETSIQRIRLTKGAEQ